MDPETERQLAAMIMEEASRLRREADRDGVAAYLVKPKIRGRANPQFLKATVRSIQQSNKIVEVNEMWRRRNVELENEQERNSRWRINDSQAEQSDGSRDSAPEHRHRHDSPADAIGDGGLKDEELEQFLHSRLKRGRGTVGSRMDETGPYLPSQADMKLRRPLMPDERMKNDWEERIAGPLPGPSVSLNQRRDWDRENWTRKQRDSSADETVEEKELHARRTTERKKRKRKEREEKDSKRVSKKKKRKKLEKSPKRRR